MKRLTVNHLAMGNLRARKKQYALLIFGIILAMIFSSGVVFFVDCMSTSLTELSYNGYGRQDFIAGNVEDISAYKDARDAGVIYDYGLAKSLGYAYTEERAEKGFAIGQYDEKAMAMSYHSVIEGRLPEKKGEIAIESDALVRLRISASVGDKISLKLNVANGTEFLKKSVDKTYTLVGILKDKRSNIITYNGSKMLKLLPAAIVSDKETVEPGGKESKLAYIIINPKSAYDEEVSDRFYNYCEEHELFNYEYACWTEGNYAWGLNGSNAIELKGLLAGVLSTVLAVASCVGIINAFNTNLQERKKQIGLFRAVGATRRQIIKIFGREALVISLICAPISLLVSFFGTKLIIHLMGEEMVFAPKIYVLLIGVGVSVVCVMVAALVPLFVASRISPMQSIRNIDIIRKLRRKHVKSKKVFKPSKLLAKRELMFTRGKTVLICVLLTISFVVCSFGGASIIDSLTNYVDTYDTGDYHIYSDSFGYSEYCMNKDAQGEYGIPSSVIGEVYALPYTKSISAQSEIPIALIPKKHYNIFDAYKVSYYMQFEQADYVPDVTMENFEEFAKAHSDEESDPEYEALEKKHAEERNKKFGYDGNEKTTRILSGSEADLRALNESVIAGKINIDKINSGEEIVISAPKKVGIVLNCWNNEYEDGIVEGSSVNIYYVEGINDKNELDYHDENTTLLGVVDNDIKVGDTMEVSMVFDDYQGEEGYDYSADEMFSKNARQYKKQVKVGAIVKPGDNFGSLYPYDISVLTSFDGLKSFGAPGAYSSVDVNLKYECTDEIDEAMSNELNAICSGSDYAFDSTYRQKKEEQQSQLVTLIAFAAVVILFFSICAGLINNSMATKIREGKRQMGTMRAVGASRQELVDVYSMQVFRIFTSGVISGFITYTVLYFGIILYNRIKYPDFDFSMKFICWPACVMSLIMFIICCFNLVRQIKKQMKYSIVDNIREL